MEVFILCFMPVVSVPMERDFWGILRWPGSWWSCFQSEPFTKCKWVISIISMRWSDLSALKNLCSKLPLFSAEAPASFFHLFLNYSAFITVFWWLSHPVVNYCETPFHRRLQLSLFQVLHSFKKCFGWCSCVNQDFCFCILTEFLYLLLILGT